MQNVGQYLFNGLVVSTLYLLIALGVTFVFGLTKLINFAHGQFLVIAAFVAHDLTTEGVNFFVAVLAAGLVAAILGLLSERMLFRFTLNNPYNGLIVGLGLLLVLEAATVQIWGGFGLAVQSPVTGGFEFLGAFISWNRVLVIVSAAALTAFVLWLLSATRIGQQMRGAYENPLAAAHVGVNVGRMITLAFVAGSFLAGVGGALSGTLAPIGPYDGGHIIIKGFAVALLGGLGSVSGAAKAAVLYGIGETMVAAYWSPEYVPFFTYAAIILVLLVRPSGLFGSHDIDTSGNLERRSIASPVRRQPLGPIERSAAVGGALVAIVLFFELAGTTRIQALLVLAGLYALQLYALSYIYDTTGILSTAQAGMMAVGAYTGAIVWEHFELSFWWSVPLSIVCGAVAGSVLGLLVARCGGHYMLLVTVAFGALIYQLALSVKNVTNGDTGMFVPTGPSMGPIGFETLSQQFYLILLLIVAAAVGLVVLRNTRLGRQLHALKENESLARSLGLKTMILKVIIFALSGAIAGLGGVVYLYSQRVIVPDSFSVMIGIQLVIMLVLGGSSLMGPAVGALLFVVIPEMFELSPKTQQIVFGVALMIGILLIPQGVAPSIRAGYQRLRDRVRSGWTTIGDHRRPLSAASPQAQGR
ncbi:MAG: ABC transporter permease [Acidimicrobiia bacterium]